MRLPLLVALAHRAHSLPASSSLLLYDLEPAKIAESSAESSSPLVYDIEPAAEALPLNAEREGLGGGRANQRQLAQSFRIGHPLSQIGFNHACKPSGSHAVGRL